MVILANVRYFTAKFIVFYLNFALSTFEIQLDNANVDFRGIPS